ncbi:MAG: hypothetical protein ACFFDG_06435 [Promethearchaeota archaeon]
MLKRKAKIFLLILLETFVLSATLFSNFINYDVTIVNVDDAPNDLYDLRMNGPQINITTPENKTYTEPMSGYYLATYGFENESDGSEPGGWWYGAQTVENVFSEVFSTEDGHNKVVRIIDQNNTDGWPGLYRDFTPSRSYGTIELWFRFNVVADRVGFQIRESGNQILLLVQVDSTGNWIYYIGGSLYDVPNIPNSTPNTWHHIKIDFRCNGAPSYLDISNDRFIFTIDGISSGELQHRYSGYSSYENFDIGSGLASIVNFSVDAIGLSWDPNYNVGNNLNEGLLLSYQKATSLEWEGYSLDGQINRTIFGNATIPFPTDEGLHTIQVFGNESSGIDHWSEIRYFSIDYPPIEIVTPENKTYTEPMIGYYPATYGFENDLDGTVPQEWVDNSQAGCTARVSSEHLGHKKVVHFQDNSVNKLYFDKFFSAQTYGTIELWLLVEDSTNGIGIRTFNQTDHMIYITVGLNKWMYVDSTDTQLNIPAFDGVYDPVSNTWYHLTIHFRCDGAPDYKGLNENKYKVIIDGIESGELEARRDVTYVDGLDFTTSAPETTEAWVDAIGFSWDPDYTLGDNLNEGLLLSFDLVFSPDWLGYSLDGQANRTILGSTTIPFLSEGLHTIQLYGNDSIGTIYKSEIRYFSIDSPPIITINKPNPNGIFGLNAPDFNISIIDLDLNETWYSLDNGITNITFSGLTGIINQTEWDKLSDGPLTIRFYANSTGGLENFKEVIVIKDITVPIISINNPSENNFFSRNSPSFNITIIEHSLNSTWYTLNNGITNTTFTGLIGTINQTEWDKLSEGIAIIRFYANDSFGKLNYSEIIIYKDITDPDLTIFSPLNGDRFTTLPPAYHIDVNEINLESVWYSIDGGLNKYQITQYEGYINTNAWNYAPIGAITIRFCAEDKAGNFVYTDIVIQKSLPSQPLDINLIIIIIVIVSLIGIGILGGFLYSKKHVRINKLRLEVERVEKASKPKRTKIKKEQPIGIPPILNCPFCQTELSGFQKYCNYCGAKLRE